MEIVSDIPTEILREIFLHAIDGPVSNIRDNRFPWAIDRVCKSWRSAFITYPDLWTWITIDLAESHSLRQDLNAVKKYLSLCLERSRNYPLNISIHFPTKAYDNNDSILFVTFSPVWKKFFSCSHRWRIVYLANVPRQFVALNSISYTGKIPILESLTIHMPMYVGYGTFTGFQIAPFLTRFTLRTVIFAIQQWSLPWMQLTNLILRFEEIVGVDQLCILFKELRDIEELRLIVEGGKPSIDLDDFVHDSITPQFLQHLRVLQTCFVEIFGFVTAPSLSELYLEGSDFYTLTDNGDHDQAMAEDILSSFLQRSSCKIQKLTLSSFLEHHFTPLVELFPDVAEMCLTDSLMCLEHLLSPNHPGLRVLDCTARTFDVKYFIETLIKILNLRNSSLGKCPSVPLMKVIFRPVLEDGETSVLVTTLDWASFESYVQAGS